MDSVVDYPLNQLHFHINGTLLQSITHVHCLMCDDYMVRRLLCLAIWSSVNVFPDLSRAVVHLHGKTNNIAELASFDVPSLPLRPTMSPAPAHVVCHPNARPAHTSTRVTQMTARQV